MSATARSITNAAPDLYAALAAREAYEIHVWDCEDRSTCPICAEGEVKEATLREKALEKARSGDTEEAEPLTMERTSRGFSYATFADHNYQSCSIQKSSLADEECIWLGINNADPKIMASDAQRLGLPTNGETTGWVPYAVPDEVSFKTRMHLSIDDVQRLLPLLHHFVDTGELPSA